MKTYTRLLLLVIISFLAACSATTYRPTDSWLTPLENGLVVLYGVLAAFVGSLLGLVFLR